MFCHLRALGFRVWRLKISALPQTLNSESSSSRTRTEVVGLNLDFRLLNFLSEKGYSRDPNVEGPLRQEVQYSGINLLGFSAFIYEPVCRAAEHLPPLSTKNETPKLETSNSET